MSKKKILLNTNMNNNINSNRVKDLKNKNQLM